MLDAGLHEAAGRAAYIAAFTVAQAFIFEDRAKVAKTHRGVQVEFQRLTKDDPRADPELRRFLSQAYILKENADYGTDPDPGLSPEDAGAALATSRRFVEHFTALLAETSSGR